MGMHAMSKCSQYVINDVKVYNGMRKDSIKDTCSIFFKRILVGQIQRIKKGRQEWAKSL
jgi:hypothetical protein